MVPRVKLAYDRVCCLFLLSACLVCLVWILMGTFQRVYDIIHPSRRNLTTIRGYVRLGGLPDNPRTDPQDRAWFGPHDRLFTEEETEALEFNQGPSHGKFSSYSCSPQLPDIGIQLPNADFFFSIFLFLLELVMNCIQCGVGDGTVLEISTDQT